MRDDLSDGRSVVQSYFEDITATESQPLSREREAELAVRIQEGDVQARNERVQANLRFVVDVAKYYQHRGLPLADLISAGNLGLLTAAERFDATRGLKFISYAVWWIRQSILHTLMQQTRLVRLPMNKVSLLQDVTRVSAQLQKEGEGDPEVEEIATALDLPVREIMDVLCSARRSVRWTKGSTSTRSAVCWISCRTGSRKRRIPRSSGSPIARSWRRYGRVWTHGNSISSGSISVWRETRG